MNVPSVVSYKTDTLLSLLLLFLWCFWKKIPTDPLCRCGCCDCGDCGSIIVTTGGGDERWYILRMKHESMADGSEKRGFSSVKHPWKHFFLYVRRPTLDAGLRGTQHNNKNCSGKFDTCTKNRVGSKFIYTSNNNKSLQLQR